MTGHQTPKGHTGIEQRRAERRVDAATAADVSLTLDGRRVTLDRRIAEPAPVEYGTRIAERRANPQPHSIPYPDRRISPAIGEFAIADRARLLERVKVLEEALQKIVAIEPKADGLRGSGMVDDSDIKAMRAMANLARAALTPAQEGKS